MIDYSIAILAGGQSSRMGQDKALLPFQGVALLEYIQRQVAGLGRETFIITNRPHDYKQFVLPLYSDVIPGIGALGGVYSALYHASYDYCLLLACDMPFVNRQLVNHLIGLAPGFDVIMPRLEVGETEPFRAVYRKTCLGPIRDVIQAGKRRVSAFFEYVNIMYVEQPELTRFDPQLLTFFNINTPADLGQASRLAEE